MSATFFAKQSEFRKWLEKNHKTKQELIVGYYKVGSNKPSMTWSQSVDEALCFGWIDSVRRSIDKDSYCIRFTPRKPNSIWSAININKVEVLKKQGLMKPEGLAIYEIRKEPISKIYSYENAAQEFPPNFEKIFKVNKKAWDFFNKQAPSYKKLMLHHITNAKQEATRIKRLENLIAESEKLKKIR
jgi:uncharacterized protein YdeI (YjbR/CyaY-like superfamily)